MIEVPEIQRSGFEAMRRGFQMRDLSMPMGFTFCLYRGETERQNFLYGCVIAVFGDAA